MVEDPSAYRREEGVAGLVMAGGRGTRMQASGGPAAKTLVEVVGVTVLERNVHALLRAGVRDIAVSVGPHVAEVVRFVDGPLQRLAAATDSRIRALEEAAPLGNIGAAGRLRAHGVDVLVAYGDNLTALELRDVLESHRLRGPALTLAVHDERFQVPYGRLTITGDELPEVIQYDEKPTVTMTVSSAVAVLSPPALELVRPDRPVGLVDLFAATRAAGLAVAAFRHAAAWVDVNDDAARARAVDVVLADPRRFERWLDRPQVVGGVLVHSAAGVLARRVPGAAAGSPEWTLPVDVTDPDADRAGGALARTYGAEPTGVPVEFDEIDPGSSRALRHRIVPAAGSAARPPAGHAWLPVEQAQGLGASGPLRRAVARML